MEKLLNISYWFAPFPGSVNLPFWRVVIAASVALFIVGIIASFMVKKYKSDSIRRRFWMKLAVWGYMIGPVALLFTFFRFQNAYLLSMRAFIAAWIIFALIWVIFIVRYRLVALPKKLQARKEHEAFVKYLPHKK